MVDDSVGPRASGRSRRSTWVRFAPAVLAVPSWNSRQNFPDRFASLGHRRGSPGAVMNGHFRIDAQAVVDGGADVRGPNWAVLDVGGVSVTGPADRAAPDAGPGEHHGVAVRPV